MGENKGKINSQRLRAAVLRIRPGKEKVGQIHRHSTVLGRGRGQAPPQGCAGTWLTGALGCGSWRPALLQTPLGQGLTDLERGQNGVLAHGQSGGGPGGLHGQSGWAVPWRSGQPAA